MPTIRYELNESVAEVIESNVNSSKFNHRFILHSSQIADMTIFVITENLQTKLNY